MSIPCDVSKFLKSLSDLEVSKRDHTTILKVRKSLLKEKWNYLKSNHTVLTFKKIVILRQEF